MQAWVRKRELNLWRRPWANLIHKLTGFFISLKWEPRLCLAIKINSVASLPRAVVCVKSNPDKSSLWTTMPRTDNGILVDKHDYHKRKHFSMNVDCKKTAVLSPEDHCVILHHASFCKKGFRLSFLQIWIVKLHHLINSSYNYKIFSSSTSLTQSLHRLKG